MFIILGFAVIFSLIAYFGVIRRSRKIDNANDRLANAQTDKKVAQINKQTDSILKSINEEDA